jgi:hypothetical protein
MAIQNRRGNYADFTPTKMVPGELAVVLQNDPNAHDGKAIYIAFAAGSAKRLATYEDMVDQILDACEEAVAIAVVESTEEAESWANGQRNGQDVPSTDPAYHNNSKYYSQQSGTQASASAASANNAAISAGESASHAQDAETSKNAAEAIAQTLSAQSGISGTMRINGVLYATYEYVENGIPYTRLSEIVTA